LGHIKVYSKYQRCLGIVPLKNNSFMKDVFIINCLFFYFAHYLLINPIFSKTCEDIRAFWYWFVANDIGDKFYSVSFKLQYSVSFGHSVSVLCCKQNRLSGNENTFFTKKQRVQTTSAISPTLLSSHFIKLLHIVNINRQFHYSFKKLSIRIGWNCGNTRTLYKWLDHCCIMYMYNTCVQYIV
jgi:hypothetical protein